MTDPALIVPLGPLVQLPVFEKATGYSPKAVKRKIEEGIWVEGKEFFRAPDGHILVSIQGYQRWAETGQGLKSAKRLSASTSRSTASRSSAP